MCSGNSIFELILLIQAGTAYTEKRIFFFLYIETLHKNKSCDTVDTVNEYSAERVFMCYSRECVNFLKFGTLCE